jgi:23S rRNA (guanosine2251-2'-O)-methyltransferase
MARTERKRRKSPGRPGRGPARDQAPGRSGGPDGSVWLHGSHAVLAALANPARRVRRVLLTEAAARAHDAALAALPDRARLDRAGGSRIETVDRTEIERILPPGAVHQGIALLTEPLDPPALEDILDAAGPQAVLVVLDRVTDPQNAGAVLRSAAAFGALAVIAPKDHAPPVTGTLAKAASGAVEIVPLVLVTNLARALETIKQAGFWCLGLDSEAPAPLTGAQEAGRAALVLGAEGAGLRRLTREACDGLYRLPTVPPIASLNVSNAAAVGLYELARTRPRDE